MRVYSGYFNEQGDLPVQTDMELLIASCGCYQFKNYTPFVTDRPNGRDDYQILFVSEGKMHFEREGRHMVVPKGSVVVFKPFEPQRYYLRSDDFEATAFYWLHFLGSASDAMLKHFGLADRFVYSIGDCDELSILYEKIAIELQLRDSRFTEINIGYFVQCLSIISRKLEQSTRQSSNISDLVREAIIYFNTHYAHKISISAYAAEKNMSLCWFTRVFRQKYIISPRKYLTNLRISKAKELLSTTEYSVGDVAEMTGHENQLYFSRVFKSNVGCSPSDFRKNFKK